MGDIEASLSLASGERQFNHLPVTVTWLENAEGKKFREYDLSDPQQGFFLILSQADNELFIDLACDGGDVQLCYQNLLAVNAGTTMLLEPLDCSTVRVLFTDRRGAVPHLPAAASFAEARDRALAWLRNGTRVFKLKADKQNSAVAKNRDIDTAGGYTENALALTTTNYGIVFEGYDSVHDFLTMPKELPKALEGNNVDYGIYRAAPSEAQIRSDLSYYNKYWYSTSQGWGYDRNIVAHFSCVIGNHPGQNPGVAETSWKTGAGQWLEPEEVKSLWYEKTQYQWPYGWTRTKVHPKGMILLTMACYGYSSGWNTTPYMAKAFVDVKDAQGANAGAAAFMGVAGAVMIVQKMWQPPPGDPEYDPEHPFKAWDNDVFTGPFWWSMIAGEYTMWQAGELFCSHHNYYAQYSQQEPQWIMGSSIRIYGNPQVRLPPY